MCGRRQRFSDRGGGGGPGSGAVVRCAADEEEGQSQRGGRVGVGAVPCSRRVACRTSTD